ncbi:MAG: hypothetical protein EBR82_30015 [Caulobacteraceae bacterium]|nr:hypothetical protein [Caulobacteraceae bacterium]
MAEGGELTGSAEELAQARLNYLPSWLVENMGGRDAALSSIRNDIVKAEQQKAAKSYAASELSGIAAGTAPGSSAAEALRDITSSGATQADVEKLLPTSGLSAAAQYALLRTGIGSENAPGREQGGISGMDANIRHVVQTLRDQGLTSSEAAEKIVQGITTYGLNDLDVLRATGISLGDLPGTFKADIPPTQSIVNQPTQPVVPKNIVTVLPPPPPLPPLTEIFIPPTSPEPEAPPPALTAGQEGLNPGTAVVGKIPVDEQVKLPQLDTEFRASEPRTPIYDRFGRVTGYNYTPAAKLTPATGTTVFNWTPPGVTSRSRSLLNIGDVPRVTIDPVTGQLRLPLSASQKYAQDRARLSQDIANLYTKSTAGQTDVPSALPSGAAGAFRNLVMSDPTLSAQLRYRDIGEAKVNPEKVDAALAGQYGKQQYLSALQAAFDPYLASIRPQLKVSTETQKSYMEQYPDVAAAYAKLTPAERAKFPTPESYAQYHYDTYGRAEGRNPPSVGFGGGQGPGLGISGGSIPTTGTSFFAKGGPVTKKANGGDVSRETLPPKRASTLKGYGEGEEAEDARKSAREIFRALVGMDPYDKNNPTEAYRIASTATPLTMIGGGIKGIKGVGKGLSRAEQEANLARFLEPSKVKERLYHGSHKPAIVEFQTGRVLKEKQYPGNTIEPWAVDNRDAVFLTPDPKLADSFAGGDFHIGMGYTPATYPVRVQVKNPWDYDNPEHIESVINAYKKKYPLKKTKDGVPSEESMRHHRFETAMRELPLREKANWSGIEKADVQEIIRDLGHDGFFVKEGGVKNLGVYDPRRIKSDLGNEGTYDITDPNINKARGGDVSTKDFIAKFADGSPNPDEIPSVIDEREEIRSESQRMLNRLKAQGPRSTGFIKGRVPEGVARLQREVEQRQIDASKPGSAAQLSLIDRPAMRIASDIVRGAVSATPAEPTNPSEAYRLMQGLTGAYLPTAPVVRMGQSAKAAVQQPGATVASAKRGFEELGDTAAAQLARISQPNTLGSQAGAVRPYGKGTVFSGVKLQGDRSVGSSLDRYLLDADTAAFESVDSLDNLDKVEAIRNFFDTKARRYITTQLGTEKDPIFKAIKEERISNLALHDKQGLRQYAIRAAREGKSKVTKETGEPVLDAFGRPIFYPKDPQAVIDVTSEYDKMVNVNPMRMKPELIQRRFQIDDDAYIAEVEKVKEQMQQAFEAEGLDPRLVNLKEPLILTTARDTGQPYYTGYIPRMDDFIKAKLSGDSTALKDVPENIIRALDKNELLYDVSTEGPLKEILDPENIASYLATLNKKEIEGIQFEEAVVKAAKFNEEKLNRQFKGKRLKALVESGKAPDNVFSKGVSEPLLKFNENDPHPGFAWKRLEELDSTIPEGAYVGHSVGGYSLGGAGYGPSYTKGFQEGTHKVYSLRNTRNRPVTTIQVIDKGTLDNPYPVITQIKGNGAKTGNTAPVNYEKEVYDFLVKIVKPKSIQESNNFLTPLLIQYKDALETNRFIDYP